MEFNSFDDDGNARSRRGWRKGIQNLDLDVDESTVLRLNRGD